MRRFDDLSAGNIEHNGYYSMITKKADTIKRLCDKGVAKRYYLTIFRERYNKKGAILRFVGKYILFYDFWGRNYKTGAINWKNVTRKMHQNRYITISWFSEKWTHVLFSRFC